MELLMEVPDWGGDSGALAYPAAPVAERGGSSRSVRRRHHRQDAQMDRLVRGVVALRPGRDPAPAPRGAAGA
jgi:hypothetical protein